MLDTNITFKDGILLGKPKRVWTFAPFNCAEVVPHFEEDLGEKGLGKLPTSFLGLAFRRAAGNVRLNACIRSVWVARRNRSIRGFRRALSRLYFSF